MTVHAFDTSQQCDAHAWTYTYDEGPWMHCDDCKTPHPANPPHPSDVPSRFKVDQEGDGVDVTYDAPQRGEKDAPRVLWYVDDAGLVSLSVWDSEHEDPIVTLDVTVDGRVTGGHIEAEVLKRLKR